MSAIHLTDDDLDCLQEGVVPLTVAADLWRSGSYLPPITEIEDEQEEA